MDRLSVAAPGVVSAPRPDAETSRRAAVGARPHASPHEAVRRVTARAPRVSPCPVPRPDLRWAARERSVGLAAAARRAQKYVRLRAEPDRQAAELAAQPEST